MIEEKLANILADLKKDIEELSSRISTSNTNSNMIIESTVDDVRVIPNYISSLNQSLKDLDVYNKDLEEKIMNVQQAIDTLKTEIEINQNSKKDLESTEINVRNQKEKIELSISDFQERTIQLEREFNEATRQVKSLEEKYNALQAQLNEQVQVLEQKIVEVTAHLEQVKSNNKLIVYLMDAGLLDVPEAELVAVIASYPEGLKLADIKEKVNMPPVRVQPTINNLLETVIEYHPLTDTYRILETIKKELS